MVGMDGERIGRIEKGRDKADEEDHQAKHSPAASVGRSRHPADPARERAAGMPRAAMLRSLIAGPGVEQAVDQIGQQIADHGEQADDQHDGDQDRIILRQRGAPHQPARPG